MAVDSANVSAVGPWGSLVGTATGTSSVIGGSISGEGWGIGAAWVDVEVQDRRSPKQVRFTVPIVAEDRELNMWGTFMEIRPPRRRGRLYWQNLHKLSMMLSEYYITMKANQ
jgi:hypothetical protein